MADFAAVLRKAIEALKDNTPEAREKIYEKARATIDAKLAAASPLPSAELAARRKGLLEDAIAKVEAEYAPHHTESAEHDELESLLAQLNDSASARVSPPIASVGEAPEPDENASTSPSTEAPALSDEVAEEPAPDDVMVPYGGTQPVEPAAPDPGHEHASTEWAEPPFAETGELTGQHRSPLPEDAPPARRGYAWLAATLVVLALLGAAGYGAWAYREDLQQTVSLPALNDALASFRSDEAEDEPAEAATPDPEVQEAALEEDAEPEAAEAAAETQPAEERPRKFTQRLLPDGQEVDEGPAGGEPMLGEGTSVAAATQSGVPEEAPATNEAEEGIPVGQRAIFYEERTNLAEGSASNGSVVWSITQESPGNNLPPEPAIRAEATIPQRDLQLKLTIRRNADQSLPASHIVELIFLTPPDFPGGGINNVTRIAMKRNEQDTGSPLLGIPAKIADGFFLVALSDRQADIQTNSTLLGRESWIDIPIVYTSGRRALITLEKGVPGERVFREALAAWSNGSSG